MQNRNRLIVLGLLGGALWGIVAWLFFAMPLFIIELLPALIPISVFAFLLFLIGLLLLTIVGTSVIRSIAPRYAWTVILMAASLIVLYNLSPLAPAWKCYGKRLYVATVNAAGQNCTTTCTNNKKKPCGGWSSCWDKDISCSSAGIDQDGRKCQGCCFSCTVVCEDPDPPPPPVQPPTISGTVACSQAGSGGWCVGTSTLNLTASDPQNYTLTISGTIDGSSFTCPAGNTCSITLPEGDGPITYKASAAISGLSSSTGSTAWRMDVTAPIADAIYPSPNGSNGWHTTSPLSVSANGSDSLSGLASAEVSINGGAWQSNATLTDGMYVVDSRAVDNAGNSTTISRTIQLDATPPTVSPVIPLPDGLNDWFVTAPVDISVTGSDSGSGLASVQLSVDGGALLSGASLSDGVHTINFISTDNAGNTASATRTVKVDTAKPASKFSSPENGSTNTVLRGLYSLSGSSSDILSGVSSTEISLDGRNWFPLVIDSGGTWMYDWNTTSWPDGIYPVVVRTTDVAGNQELVEEAAHVTLLVNNTPPLIKLTPEWFVWESGSLLIKTEYFPVRDGMIVISDPEKRWPSIRIPFGKKYPAEIKWDRRFANGVLAPFGTYRVTVSACNVYDLCAEKTASINIPRIAVVLPPSPVPTIMVEVEPEVLPEVKEESIETPLAPVVMASSEGIEVRVQSKAGNKPALSILPFVVLVALMWAVTSAALADKRPKAIHAIAKSISQRHKGDF